MLRGFYFITDRALCGKSDVEAVKEALEGGSTVVQYREGELDRAEKARVARKIRLMCSGRATFIINDDIDLALEVGADGVHIGQGDMTVKTARYLLGRDKLIGVTVHTVEEAVAADKAGADYVAASPIFATSTKADAGEPAGVELIEEVKSVVHIPVAAIGGINEQNVDKVLKAGADMVCAIKASICTEDITGAVEFFTSKFREKWKK
jgi:thiamine-phosphate pyrophosphorylase